MAPSAFDKGLNMDNENISLNSGSRWHRWEPHIHAPGTVLNDQFSGPDSWDRYLTTLEQLTPVIRAIGITDYYSTDTYEQLCEEKNKGRLPDCDLIFPNVEMRLGVGTIKGRWINIHLLVSPEDPEHVSQLRRFLARLTFKAHDDSFSCSRDDLIRLGHKHDREIIDPLKALEVGSQQFKVSFDLLKSTYQDSRWAQDNILIGVAGSGTDGTAGIQDGADVTLRTEIEKFAHVIFASSASQRDFWLGLKTSDATEFKLRYGGLKPCLHGCDAHDHRKIGAPDGERYSWIKGAFAFDALRQACIDPAGRAYVGTEPPISATQSQIISGVTLKDAQWALTPALSLNPGLVAIIGARGSGKTALADIIAAGCDAISDKLSRSSFLTRAEDLLGTASVEIKWHTGDIINRPLRSSLDNASSDQYPRARYLSQQFVEELCSSVGMTDSLLHEIERVIFEAHPLSDRDGAINFKELLEMRASLYRQARTREEENIALLSDRISAEVEKDQTLPELNAQILIKNELIASYTTDRSKLVSKGSEVRVARLGELSTAAEKIRGYLRYYNNQQQSLLSLIDEVGDVRTRQAPDTLRTSQERHAASGIKGDEWSSFLLDYIGDVDKTLKENLEKARASAASWKGEPIPPQTDPQQTLITDSKPLDQLPLSLLEAEIARLEKLISLDRATTDKFIAISKRVTEETATLEKLKEKLIDCDQAKHRIPQLLNDREQTYFKIFESILSEQRVLIELYRPLMIKLASAEGTLNKLSFTVSRSADIESWANKGESLLDLRKGVFRGRGTLKQRADEALKSAWETGDPDTIKAAIKAFRADNQQALLDHSPVPKEDLVKYRAWLKGFAQWLYGTEHISIQYSIDYEGVDITKLSPGTRGIVLLLLYLAMDDADDRPLIIDQPEENLDPKSIFDELVGLFIKAKSKRQIIIVTHNANLVINTDADQIIVAQSGEHRPGELPKISYTSGGFESAAIRKAVCDILEGGEHAFKERARRLRVRLER
jgi:energy-coupling factor transporter ATP-binding protein EcfA2